MSRTFFHIVLLKVISRRPDADRCPGVVLGSKGRCALWLGDYITQRQGKLLLAEQLLKLGDGLQGLWLEDLLRLVPVLHEYPGSKLGIGDDAITPASY